MVVDNADGTNTGYGDYRLREGTDDRKHELSTRMLTKMKLQLDRLIAKYESYDADTGIDWTQDPQAQYLVELLRIDRDGPGGIAEELATAPFADWPHAPYPHWVIFPKVCDGGDVVYKTYDEFIDGWEADLPPAAEGRGQAFTLSF